MKDENKTKNQLLDELIQMRRCVVELEQAEDEHKQAEEMLRQSESKYRTLFDQATDGIMVMPVSGTTFTVNQSFAQLHGYTSPKEMEHLTLSDLDTPETAKLAPERLYRLSRGESMNFDVEHYQKNGHKVLLNVSCNLVQIGGESCFLGFHQDITHRKRAEDALRESERKYHSIFENAPVGIFRSTTEGKLVEANPEAAHLLGYDSPEEIIAVTNRKSTAETLYVNPESRPEIVKRALSSKGEWVRAERCLRRKTGETILVRFFFRTVPNESLESDLIEGFMEDITERRRANELIRLQRDLALALGSTSSMAEALEQLLLVTMQIEEIDSGVVYLVDAATGEVQLVSHAGLSSRFIDQVSFYGPETPYARFVMQGELTYWPNVRGVLGIGDLMEREGLISLAVIPVKFKGRVVAVLNLASRTQSEVPGSTRRALETIAARIGGIVSRINAEEALKRERENMAEANGALKLLLRQREEDRRELEEAMLTNVKNLVLPYGEKLKNTRLTPEQALFLEIIESHLREVTSPFLRTLSRQFAELSPMEIRVADLVRGGRTSKEIAKILGSSEKSVLFHRQNVRRKLGLKGRNKNLQSFLASFS
jgi:PAS domain S-box-containing protein